MGKKWFTLIELIVVMALIAIIWTISFVSFTSYMVWVRDSNRITQINNMRDGIVLAINKWISLKPEWAIEIQFNWVPKAFQWYFWPTLIEKIGYSMDWIDPKDDTYFAFTLSANGKYFQIMSLLEDEENLKWVWYKKAIIKDNNGRVPYLVWSKEIGIFFNDEIVPVHEYATSPLDIKSDNADYYNVILRNDRIVSSTWGALLANITKVIDNYSDNIYSCAEQKHIFADYEIWNPSISNTPWQNTNASAPCYFTCKTWYTFSNNTCTPSVLTRTNVECSWLPTNAEWNGTDKINQTWDLDISNYLPSNAWVYNTIASTSQCRFKCLPYHNWDGSECKAITNEWECTWIPAYAVRNTAEKINQTWNGTEWIPTLEWVYSLASSTTTCKFKCEDNYDYVWGICVPATQNGTCIFPPNSTRNSVNSMTQTWNGTEWSPSVEWVYNLTSSLTECRYTCNTNYTYNSTTKTCDPDTQTWILCTWNVPNSVWFGDNSISQTWNGTDWLPTNVWVYNDTTPWSNQCHFKCDVWYNWNGTSCDLSPLEQFKLVLRDKCWIPEVTFNANFNSTTWVYTWDLNCSSKSLNDSDLVKFTPLVQVTWNLDLSTNNLTKLDWLDSLTRVWVNLRLNNNNLVDISKLALLTNATNIYLQNNNALSSLTWLASVTNVVYLDISWSNFTWLSWVSSLTSLIELRANDNNITDITWLSGLSNLDILNLNDNNLSTITTIWTLTWLKQVYLANNNLSNISSLSTISPDILHIYWNSSITSLSVFDWYNVSWKILALDDKTYTTKISALSKVCLDWNVKNAALAVYPDLTKICKNPSWSYVNFEWNNKWAWYISWGTNTNTSAIWWQTAAGWGWYYDSGYTSTANTWPDNGHDWNTYIFAETSTNGKWYSNKTSFLFYNITDDSNFINFYYHAYGNRMWTLTFATYNWSSWTTRYTISWQQHSSSAQAWTKTPDITIPAWTTIVRLQYTSSNWERWDFALDAIRVWQK